MRILIALLGGLIVGAIIAALNLSMAATIPLALLGGGLWGYFGPDWICGKERN